MQDRIYRRPDIRLGIAEGPRVITEIASLMSVAPFLAWAPRGDGHAILVLPGFGGSDRSTALLRAFLKGTGYQSYPWNLGANLGPRMPDLMAALASRLKEVHVESGESRVSIIGWSLGGVYARLLAHLFPELVRQVITLGSPFAGSPRSTAVYPIVAGMSDVPLEQRPTDHLRLLAGDPLKNTPSTAIFSKTDGIVPWQIASQQPSSIADNIEVYASHLGLGFNPAVLYALTDRLSNQPDNWRPFQRTGWKRLVYGPARLEPDYDEGMSGHRATGG
jgi:pimeloyl-ACP methyl ester carboxylesterase